MKFDNSFDISLPPGEAWPILLDIERIAPCVPGATLREIVDKKSFKGAVSVRLGPVNLTFEGEAMFEVIDKNTHTAKIKAHGRDSNGRGGANVAVVFLVKPRNGGSTVLINTDLNLSGSIAQYGRGVGMIQSVASQLINQFANALENQIVSDTNFRVAKVYSHPTAHLKTPGPSAEGQQKISGYRLIFAALGSWLKEIFIKRH